jgi:hypothetical protein
MYDFLFIRTHAAATAVDDGRLMIKKFLLNDSAARQSHIWMNDSDNSKKWLNTIQISNCIHT